MLNNRRITESDRPVWMCMLNIIMIRYFDSFCLHHLQHMILLMFVNLNVTLPIFYSTQNRLDCSKIVDKICYYDAP